MRRPRMYFLVGGAILALSLVLGLQIFLLYGQIGEKDRTIRLLVGEVQRISAQLTPLTGQLDGREDSIVALRFRLREKEKEVRLLEEEKLRRRSEFLSMEQDLSKTGEELRSLRQRLSETEKDLTALGEERKKLGEELRALQEARALAEAREKEIAILKQDNAKQARALEEMQQQFDALRNKPPAQAPPAQGEKKPQAPSR